MNWISNIFKKKITSVEKSDNLQFDGFCHFEKGKQLYFEKNLVEALRQFDLAIENGYDNSVYELRGSCLHELDYAYDAIEDFNKAILLSPNDCNTYFSRSLSKHAILDFEGEIADLEKAIELSKEKNKLNDAYNEEAIKMGYSSGIEGMVQPRLICAKMDLELKEKRKDIFALRLAHIKKR